ncbi:hypothetical protein J3F83DRAFT_749313 [Trichoderma novae-zelandiae]
MIHGFAMSVSAIECDCKPHDSCIEIVQHGARSDNSPGTTTMTPSKVQLMPRPSKSPFTDVLSDSNYGDQSRTSAIDVWDTAARALWNAGEVKDRPAKREQLLHCLNSFDSHVRKLSKTLGTAGLAQPTGSERYGWYARGSTTPWSVDNSLLGLAAQSAVLPCLCKGCVAYMCGSANFFLPRRCFWVFLNMRFLGTRIRTRNSRKTTFALDSPENDGWPRPSTCWKGGSINPRCAPGAEPVASGKR